VRDEGGAAVIVCPKCGATLESETADCAVCGAEPIAREPDVDVDQIKRKISHIRFASTDARRWAARGAVAGLVLGFLVGVGISLWQGSSFAGMGIDFTMAFMTCVWCSLFGCALGGGFGSLVVTFCKPIYVAVFCDTKQFDREYGPSNQPPGGTGKTNP
jgi:hypothetical protein